MRAQNYGRIVMTTSSSGLYGNFGQSNYGAAKMALVGLMQTLSIEGAKNDIRVNCLAPTAATRMTEKLMPEAVLTPARARRGDAGPARAGRRGRADARDPVRRRRLVRARPRDADAGHPRRPARRCRRAGRGAVRRDLRPRRRDGSRERRRAGHARDRQGDARRAAEPRRASAPAAQSPRARRCSALDQVAGAQRARALRLGRGAVLDHRPRRDVEARSPPATPSGRRSSRRARRRCRRWRAPHCRSR